MTQNSLNAMRVQVPSIPKDIPAVRQEFSQENRQQLMRLIEQFHAKVKTLEDGTHPEYLALLDTISKTQERLHNIAKIQNELAIEHADNICRSTEQQIASDYQLGREDVKEKIYARLRQKKKDIKELIDKLQAKGIQCVDEMQLFNELKVPNKKRERKIVIQGQGLGAFKLSEAEAKGDIALIKQRAELADLGRK